MQDSIVIIGAGHAGVSAASSLHQAGYAGEITLFSEEPALPYHRPPLSKTHLTSDTTNNTRLLRPAKFYEEHNIHLHHATVTAIDATKKCVTANATAFPYNALILATGCRARKIDRYSHFNNVFTLRSVVDAEKLRNQLQHCQHLTIIGGGFIGLEVAASVRALGCKVDVIEAQSRVLKRAVPTVISDYLCQQHQVHGVQFHLNTAISATENNEEAITEIVLDNGHAFKTDAMLVCIGDQPNIDLAQSLGLHIELDAIYVDDHLRTSQQAIYAIGDCCSFQLPISDSLMRLASVQNANDQGRVVAQNILGNATRYNPTPWFWTDQYDLKLQIAGIDKANSEYLVRGDIQSKQFSVLTHRAGQLLAVYSVNQAKDHISAKGCLADKPLIDCERASDMSRPLTEAIISN